MDKEIRILKSERRADKNIEESNGWIDQELIGCKFSDERHKKRFKDLLNQMWTGFGETIPFACQDWANTKGAYRFFSNDRINEKEILKGHFQSTGDRFINTEGPILILQDTTEFSYKREQAHLIGVTHQLPKQVKAKTGKVKGHTNSGKNMC